MSSSGTLSRRALLRPRSGRQTPADLAARWAQAAIPEARAVWAPVAEALEDFAAACAGDAVTSVFGVQSTPAARAAIDALFADAAPGTPVALSVWAPGVVPQLLKAAAALDRPPARLPGVWGWSSRERLRQDLDHHADDVRYRRGELLVEPDALLAGVPAVAVALAGHGSVARERFDAILAGYARPGGAVPVPYLLVVAVRR